MVKRLSDQTVTDVIEARRNAARSGKTVTVTVDGAQVSLERPQPSPGDWRDVWIYFLLTDRFNNPTQGPKGPAWNQKFDFWHGGTFKGVEAQLGYLCDLGVGAIWLSPVLKTPRESAASSRFRGWSASKRWSSWQTRL